MYCSANACKFAPWDHVQAPCRVFFSHFQLFFNVRHIYCNNRINHTATKKISGNTMFFLVTASIFRCNITTSFVAQHIGGNIIYQSQWLSFVAKTLNYILPRKQTLWQQQPYCGKKIIISEPDLLLWWEHQYFATKLQNRCNTTYLMQLIRCSCKDFCGNRPKI